MKPEEEVLQKIKHVLSVGNESQAIRLIEQYGEFKQEESKQFSLNAVGCSLPSKEELLLVYEKTITEKHKGLDELEKEWIKLGFMYYHRYLSDKNK